MALITDIRNSLYSLATDAVTVNRQFDVGEVNRLNWRKMVEDFEAGGTDGFSPPYLVWQWGYSYEIEGGAANLVYEQFIHLYYITENNDKSSEQLLEEIEDALISLRDNIRNSDSNDYIVMDANIDYSDSVSCNSFFLVNNASMYGGVVILKMIFGECP